MVKMGMVGGRGIGGRGIWGRGMVGLGVNSNTLILDISYETTLMISMVGDYLNTTIGQGNSVLSCHDTVLILNLFLCEVCSGV